MRVPLIHVPGEGVTSVERRFAEASGRNAAAKRRSTDTLLGLFMIGSPVSIKTLAPSSEEVHP